MKGVLSPVLTPFEADGTPSTRRFVAHCRWLHDQGVGLAVFGTNSEANSLSVAEKRSLLDALLESGMPADRLMPGTGSCALPDAIELTRHAVAAGCAGVLMLPPFYYKDASDEGLYRAFATVIERVADPRLRVYLYHIPPVAQVGLSHALIGRLIDAFPGIVAGIKDSGGDWENTRTMLERFQPRGFDVFAGSETILLKTLQAGGAGCITATGNVNPAAIVRLYRTWTDAGAGADTEAQAQAQAPAQAQQDALNRTRAAFQQFPMIAAMKATLAAQSGDPGWARVRPPLVELDADARGRLAASLAALDFRIPGAAALAMPDDQR